MSRASRPSSRKTRPGASRSSISAFRNRPRTTRPYRFLAHTADILLSFRGRGWPAFYRNAAAGLLRAWDIPRGAARRPRAIEVREVGPEETLVAWLNEINFLVGAKGFAPGRIRILSAGPGHVRARLLGGAPKARAGREIKAATFNGLRVTRRGGVLRARVLLDV